MKLSFLKLLFVCSLLILLNSCNNKCEHSNDLSESCYPNSNKPSQIITYKEMADMMNAFENGSKKELNKYLKKESKGNDSVSTVYNWYRLDDLKQYIAYIERISKEKEIEVTGFRIYSSQYPKKYKEKKLQNRNTLIFTPTTTVDGRDDAAFEPLYSQKNSPLLVSDLLKIMKGEEIKDKIIFNKYSKLMDSLTSSSANRIKTTPPY